MRKAMIVLAAATVGGCLADRGEEQPSAVPLPVQRAFENNCARSGCHNATTRVANLSLAPADLDEVIGKTTPNSELPLVEIGDLYGSYLALKILDDPEISGEPMPLGGIDSHYEVGLILSWIAGIEIPDKVAPPPPPTEVTFAEDVLPLLNDNCSGGSCHDPDGGGASVWVLDGESTYDALVDADHGPRKLIDGENQDLGNSQVWLSVTDTGGIPMPLSRPPLDGYELQIIRDWILAGAPE